MKYFIPIKPAQAVNGRYYCPNCKVTIMNKFRSCCLVCGQALDWSDIKGEDEDNEEYYSNMDESE